MSATINRDWLGSAPFNGVVPHAPVLTMIKSFTHKGLETFFLLAIRAESNSLTPENYVCSWQPWILPLLLRT